MRKARSVAWFSTAGFHQRSKWITCEAAVRFRPVPPALSDSTKNGGPSSRWNWSTSALPLADGRAAVQHQAGPAEAPCARKPASGSVISRNCVKTSAFSWREAISSQISASRANLPLSSAA